LSLFDYQVIDAESGNLIREIMAHGSKMLCPIGNDVLYLPSQRMATALGFLCFNRSIFYA
jgi:hypothetical protein